ncbi:MAG: endonuclease III [Myxococcales bacterium]|nr:endonuclease III [Myxococcales bacterium]
MGHRPRSTTSPTPATGPDVPAMLAALAATWPDATCELDHQDAYQLLCATILAAQSTDKMINTLTPALFAKYPDAHALAAAEPTEVEPLIYKSGFFRAKARSLVGMARALVERHGGQVPADLDALVALPGVARKTANVVLSTALGVTVGVVVDTHVTRIAHLLGLTRETDPVKIERDLMAALPRTAWKTFADRVIWHGRRVCFARRPQCERCALAPLCPSASVPGRGAETEAATAAPKPAAKARPVKATPATPRPAAKATPVKATPATTARPAAKATPAAKAVTAAKVTAAKVTAAKVTAAKVTAAKVTAAKVTASRSTASAQPTPARAKPRPGRAR